MSTHAHITTRKAYLFSFRSYVHTHPQWHQHMQLAPYEDRLAPYQDKLAPYGERGMALFEDTVTGCFSNCQIREKILIKYGKRTPENNAERMAILILVGSHHLR